MADVNKASDLILDHVDKQRLALGEQPYLAKNDPLALSVRTRRCLSGMRPLSRPVRRLCHPCVIRWCGTGAEKGLGNGQNILPAYGLEGQGGFPEHDGTEDIRTGDYYDVQEPECGTGLGI